MNLKYSSVEDLCICVEDALHAFVCVEADGGRRNLVQPTVPTLHTPNCFFRTVPGKDILQTSKHSCNRT
jgi:hypothetical protein